MEAIIDNNSHATDFMRMDRTADPSILGKVEQEAELGVQLLLFRIQRTSRENHPCLDPTAQGLLI